MQYIARMCVCDRHVSLYIIAIAIFRDVYISNYIPIRVTFYIISLLDNSKSLRIPSHTRRKKCYYINSIGVIEINVIKAMTILMNEIQ